MAITPGNQTSQTPANTQFSALKTEVARFVKAPNSTEVLGVAGDGINDTVRKLNSRTWEFNLTSEIITFVADQKEYDVADTFKLPRHVECLNSSSVAAGHRILYLPHKDFVDAFPDRRTSGSPLFYTVLNPRNYGQMTFEIAPSTAFVALYPTARHWYYKYIQVLSLATDTLAVPNDVERVIVWGAKQYVAELYGNMQQVQIATRNFQEAYEQVRRQHRRDDTDWAVTAHRRRR